jgi:dCTP deaminase
MPGETVLGITRERVKLGPGLCGWLEGRSRFARLGLMVHISAPFMGPGIDSQQVLEMSNFRPGSTGGGAGHADLSVHLSADGW